MASAAWLPVWVPRRREEARRDEFADFLARVSKRAFDLDRRPHLCGNAKLPPARDHRGTPAKEIPTSGLPHTPPTTNKLPVEVPPRLLPPTGPADKNSGGQPSRHDSRAADLGRQGLPANTPSGLSHPPTAD
ncbi:unnamed protein product [Penicillium viridicatum]